jgi:phosphoserine phosphatase RsbU/P
METKPLKVLLVEDERITALMLKNALDNLPGKPFLVEWAHSLSSGAKHLSEERIDVVLLDLTLADSEGLNTFLRARALAPPTVPIVVLTGLDDDVLGQTAVREGAEDFLVKGQVGPPEVGRCLRYAIERHRRRQTEELLLANQEEFRAARAIQERLFPIVPHLSSFDMAGMSYCARGTCGDYFDYLRMHNGCVGIVIADVCGHGLGPAILMASTRAYLRALARAHSEVSEILTLANQVLVEDTRQESFVTLVLARLDPHTRSFTYASAGHPTGYVLNAAGVVKASLESTGIPLGINPDSTYPSSAPLILDPGDMVLLLTDGVLEAQAPDRAPFQAERVLHLMRLYRNDPAMRIVENLYHAVRAFALDAPQMDDISVVVLKVGPVVD